jgi:hypothetical protein
MAPAIQVPIKIDNRACLKSILKIVATNEPVQAPVTGSGMATRNPSRISLYISITLPLRHASSSSQLSHLLKKAILPRRRAIVPKKRSSRGTGMRVPMINDS